MLSRGYDQAQEDIPNANEFDNDITAEGSFEVVTLFPYLITWIAKHLVRKRHLLQIAGLKQPNLSLFDLTLVNL